MVCSSCNPHAILQAFCEHRACVEQRFIQTLVPQFSIKAFDEAVLLGLSGRDVVPIDARILNPFEDRHAGERSSVV